MVLPPDVRNGRRRDGLSADACRGTRNRRQPVRLSCTQGRKRASEWTDVSDFDPNYFMSDASMGEAADAIAERILREPRLSKFRGWDVDLFDAGIDFRDPIRGGAHLWLCQHEPPRRELLRCTGSATMGTNDVLNDASKTKHPEMEWPLSVVHTFAVVGFRGRELREFRNQLPVVCVPDPATAKVVWGARRSQR